MALNWSEARIKEMIERLQIQIDLWASRGFNCTIKKQQVAYYQNELAKVQAANRTLAEQIAEPTVEQTMSHIELTFAEMGIAPEPVVELDRPEYHWITPSCLDLRGSSVEYHNDDLTTVESARSKHAMAVIARGMGFATWTVSLAEIRNGHRAYVAIDSDGNILCRDAKARRVEYYPAEMMVA